MSVDLSDTIDPDMKQTAAEAVSMKGAAFAFQRPLNAESLPGEGTPVLPSEVDAVANLPDADLRLPSAAQVASLPLPLPINEPVGDFGPLPKDLSDFESIVLSTTEDGMRLPDDSLGDLPDMMLPDEDIILAVVGVNWKEHVVKAGETLSDVALHYGGVTAQDILRANGLKDANRLAAQQILLIPDSSLFVEDTLDEVRTRQARIAALREKIVPLEIAAYVVAAGDSLWSIANAQNLEVDTLIGSNVFKDASMLHPGVVLRIPNQDGIFYRVKKGDTLEGIAKKYQVSVDKIRKASPLADLVALKIGEEIFLPGARPEAIAEPQTAAKKPGAGGTSRKSVASSTQQKVTRAYRWPVMGKINSPFGWRRHPITKRRDFHTGLDIKAGRGTVIRSAREGRAAYVGWMGGYGKVVVVDHGNGQSTLYAHCSALLVQQGTKISAGQNIARVGSTGRTTGPHLHFEVRNGNSPENPLKYLK
ncbi:MAG: LysM peptidoglycan-binding domain-containing M23 family metallopeptidase [Synergistaceae bacterium]|nr:LysM peptidoglycan-binding domain-containing M23 family metallopeptidase [Synergistaceae bacterium]